MTLEEIKDAIKTISLSHKQINDFDYGEDYLASEKSHNYPLSFLEIPYSLTLSLTSSQQKTIQFALLVLLDPSNDDMINDHKSISIAEQIGDSIVTKIQKSLPDLKLDSVSGVSLREFSDDNVSGFRYDITARTLRACFDESDFNG